MNIEEIKDEYRARVEPRWKSVSEILEEAAKETKAYKDLEEENKKLKSDLKKYKEQYEHSMWED